jgi:hypothetical protein
VCLDVDLNFLKEFIQGFGVVKPRKETKPLKIQATKGVDELTLNHKRMRLCFLGDSKDDVHRPDKILGSALLLPSDFQCFSRFLRSAIVPNFQKSLS